MTEPSQARKSIDVSPLDLAKTICIFNDYNAGQVPAGEFAPENFLKLAREVVRLSLASAGVTPSDDEVAAYRDLFRAELAKRMDTKHPSASPSTEAHTIALTAFLKKRGTSYATTRAEKYRRGFIFLLAAALKGGFFDGDQETKDRVITFLHTENIEAGYSCEDVLNAAMGLPPLDSGKKL